MYMSGMRGKCLDMLHVYEDNLWALGDKSIKIPMIPSPVVVAATSTETSDDEKSGEVDTNKEKTDSEAIGDSTAKQIGKLKLDEDSSSAELCGNRVIEQEAKEETQQESDTETGSKEDEIDHEKLLVDSFLCAVKFKSKELKLPVIVSTFMKVMQSCWYVYLLALDFETETNLI